MPRPTDYQTQTQQMEIDDIENSKSWKLNAKKTSELHIKRERFLQLKNKKNQSVPCEKFTCACGYEKEEGKMVSRSEPYMYTSRYLIP